MIPKHKADCRAAFIYGIWCKDTDCPWCDWETTVEMNVWCGFALFSLAVILTGIVALLVKWMV